MDPFNPGDRVKILSCSDPCQAAMVGKIGFVERIFVISCLVIVYVGDDIGAFTKDELEPAP